MKKRSNLKYLNQLETLRLIHSQKQLDLTHQKKESTPAPQIEFEKQKSIGSLHQTVKRIKINNLVKQFAYKIKRNITTAQPIKYDAIQNSLEQMKTLKDMKRPYHFPQRLRAIIIGIDIICILIIQILSNFQAFIEGHRRQNGGYISIMLIQIFCLIVFLTKIIIRLTTVKVTKEDHQQTLKYLAKDYVFSIVFILDFSLLLITMLKLAFPESQQIGVIAFVVSIICFQVIKRNTQIIQKIYVDNFKKKQYINLIKIVTFNIFFSQFVSAMLLSMALFNEENNWIIKAINNGVINENRTWWEEYIYSVYWSIITITTVGYGDVTPANYFEAVILSIIMLSGTIILSYNISEISNIISNLRSIDHKKKQQAAIFKRMANDEKISLELQSKISQYIYKSSEIKAEFQFNERKNFLNKLPSQMKEQFQSQYSKNIFSKIPFFKLLQPQTLIKLADKLKGDIFYPGQYVTQKNCQFSQILLLKDGDIGFAYNKLNSSLNGLILQRRSIKSSQNSPYLLNKHLLSQQQDLNYQVVAESYCFMLIIQFEEFQQIIRQSKKDLQFYFHMSHKVTFIEQEWELFQCEFCAPKRHSIFLCPRLHYIPYKSIVIQRFISGKIIYQQGDKHFLRSLNHIKKRKSLLNWKECFKYYQNRSKMVKKKKIKRRTSIDSEQINLDAETRQKYSESFAQKVVQKLIQRQCYPSTQQIIIQDQLQMDKMHNYSYFFPNFNPSRLTLFRLRTSDRYQYINNTL